MVDNIIEEVKLHNCNCKYDTTCRKNIIVTDNPKELSYNISCTNCGKIWTIGFKDLLVSAYHNEKYTDKVHEQGLRCELILELNENANQLWTIDDVLAIILTN